jgi:hypothetical protein
MLMKEDIALVLRTVKPPEKGVEGEGSNDRTNGLRAAVDSPVSAQRPISIMMYLSAARVKDRAPRALRGVVWLSGTFERGHLETVRLTLSPPGKCWRRR